MANQNTVNINTTEGLSRLRQTSSNEQLTATSQSKQYDNYLCSMLMLGGTTFNNIQELTGYTKASLSGYSAYFSELAKTADTQRATAAFSKVANPQYDAIREQALKSPYGSILGKDQDLLEMNNTNLAIHSIGILPEMISQPLVMVVNATAIEATRRIVAPQMGFYEFAKLEDSDPTLRMIKSARQVALLALLTAVPGAGAALATTGTISSLGVVGNRLLKVGNSEQGSEKIFTLGDALLDLKLFNEILDASFNSRMISTVTPILLGAKIVSKLYDNLDTTNDGIVSIASGSKVKYENILSDPNAIFRACGHGLVVTGAMMDLFDISAAGIGRKANTLAELAKLKEMALAKAAISNIDDAILPQSSELKLPVTSRRIVEIGKDSNGYSITRLGNSTLRFYLNDLTALINPSPELRAQGFYSTQVDRMLESKGEEFTRSHLQKLLGLTDYSTSEAEALGTNGKIFVVSRLPQNLRLDVEQAVASFVNENHPHTTEEQFAKILQWNIKRVERAIQIHESVHLKEKNNQEYQAWMISNEFLAFDQDLGNGLASIPLGFTLNGSKLRVVRQEEIANEKLKGSLALEDYQGKPLAFNSQWINSISRQLSYNPSGFLAAAMSQGDPEPVNMDLSTPNTVSLNICARNIEDHVKIDNLTESIKIIFKKEIHDLGFTPTSEEYKYLVNKIAEKRPVLAMNILIFTSIDDPIFIETFINKIIEQVLPNLISHININEAFNFIENVVHVLRNKGIEIKDKKAFRLQKFKETIAHLNSTGAPNTSNSELIIFEKLINTYNYIPSQGVMDVFSYVSRLDDGHLGHKDLLVIFRACDSQHGERANVIFPRVKDVFERYPDFTAYSPSNRIHREAFEAYFHGGIRSISPELFHMFCTKYRRSKFLGLAELRRFNKISQKLLTGESLTSEERNDPLYPSLIQHVYDPVFFETEQSVESLLLKIETEYGANRENAAEKRLKTADGSSLFQGTSFIIGFENDWPNMTLTSDSMQELSATNIVSLGKIELFIKILRESMNSKLEESEELQLLRNFSRNSFRKPNFFAINKMAGDDLDINEDKVPLKILCKYATEAEKQKLAALLLEYERSKNFSTFMSIYTLLVEIADHTIEDWTSDIFARNSDLQDHSDSPNADTKISFDKWIILQDRKAGHAIFNQKQTTDEILSERDIIRKYFLSSKIHDNYFIPLLSELKESIIDLSAGRSDFVTGNIKVDNQLRTLSEIEARKKVIARWIKQRLRGSNQVTGILTLSDESFFARASTGISTGHNVWGWMQDSYLQFVLYSPDLGKCVGVIQLHQFIVPTSKQGRLPEDIRNKNPILARVNVSSSLLLKMNNETFCGKLINELKIFCNTNNLQLFLPENTGQNLLSNRSDIIAHLQTAYCNDGNSITLGETHAIEIERHNEEKEISIVFYVR